MIKIDEEEIKNIFIDYIDENNLNKIKIISQIKPSNIRDYNFYRSGGFSGELLNGTHLIIEINLPDSDEVLFQSVLNNLSYKFIKSPENQILIIRNS